MSAYFLFFLLLHPFSSFGAATRYQKDFSCTAKMCALSVSYVDIDGKTKVQIFAIKPIAPGMQTKLPLTDKVSARNC
jgi:hypothetical protein